MNFIPLKNMHKALKQARVDQQKICSENRRRSKRATSNYSSKAGCRRTGVTTTASRGAAKEWATTVGGYVDTAEYSAKEYATGTTVAVGSAKQWATKDSTAVDTLYSAKEYASGDATTSGGSAKAWATDTSSPDGTSTKSAKTWAGEASASAATAENSAIEYSIALG